MHLDEERLERLLHGELSSDMMASAREHVSACGACRARADEARASESRLHALLEQLDHPMPRFDLQAVIDQARPRQVHWMRWAAGIALVMALGGVAYATPGSPVRRFLESLWRRPLTQTPAEQAPVLPEAGLTGPAAAGIAVRPGRRLVIEFTSPADGARVRVALGEGEEVVVRAAAGAATFSSRAERLEIGVREGATLDVTIPRAAPRVEVVVGGRRVFLKEGAKVATSAAADSGTWVLPLGRR